MPQLDLIGKFFPNLTEQQLRQLEALPELYREWNDKINVISRKDIEHIEAHHILHSLAIAKFAHFAHNSKVLDIGTGGGFPGIPLAILYPNTHFTLIDGTGKKIAVVRAISEAIGLVNVNPMHIRAEDLPQNGFNFVVSRGALPLYDLYRFSQKLIDHRKDGTAVLPNGLLALKGGNLSEELKPFRKIAIVESIDDYFPGLSYFEEKKVIYISM